MDKKKALLVILIATVLAFVAVLMTTKKSPTEKILELEKQQEVVKEEMDNEELDVQKQADEQDIIQTPVIKTDIKPIVKPIAPAVEHPVFEPLQVEVTKEGIAAEEKIDPGVMKESGTNNVIVTREFKSKSRGKYVFEGFGIQVAPTK